MPTKLLWHGNEAMQHVNARKVTALRLIVLAIVRRAKILLTVAGTGKVKGKRVGPVQHASAGEPPHKQTGRLRASVTYEVDADAGLARAGTNVVYGRHQELGTKRGLAPHPWLRPAYEWAIANLNQVLAPLNSK